MGCQQGTKLGKSWLRSSKEHSKLLTWNVIMLVVREGPKHGSRQVFTTSPTAQMFRMNSREAIWSITIAAATTDTDAGLNDVEYFQCKDGRHGRVISAFEKKGEKVDFFISYQLFNCDDCTLELLAAQLIHTKCIGYDKDQERFMYCE